MYGHVERYNVLYNIAVLDSKKYSTYNFKSVILKFAVFNFLFKNIPTLRKIKKKRNNNYKF